jgi:hypothetical protein
MRNALETRGNRSVGRLPKYNTSRREYGRRVSSRARYQPSRLQPGEREAEHEPGLYANRYRFAKRKFRRSIHAYSDYPGISQQLSSMPYKRGSRRKASTSIFSVWWNDYKIPVLHRTAIHAVSDDASTPKLIRRLHGESPKQSLCICNQNDQERGHGPN